MHKITTVQSPSSRLAAWRQLRTSDNVTVQTILDWFAEIKILPRYIDYWTPNDWPNIFDIVGEGYFCQNGITLVMAATLYYHKFIKTTELEFIAISNHITGVEGLVCVDGDNCYNFIRDKVVSRQYMQEHSTKYTSHIITIDKLFD